MPKAEKGTPKDIANRMKAKGLAKLRWYCQMCQKQCRDENGFKCHTTSESHQRQLLLFADNMGTYLDSFSRDFKDGYLQLLSRRSGTKRVNANNVYQEYIHDRNHIHMNATKWETLTDFVKWLGRENFCKVDETEKGWYVTYIDRSPEAIQLEAKKHKKVKNARDEEDRLQAFINQQIEAGKASSSGIEEPKELAPLERVGGDPLSLKISLSSTKSSKTPGSANPLKAEKQEVKNKDTKMTQKRSARELIMEDERKAKKQKLDLLTPCQRPWMTEGIFVKVITNDFGSKFYKQKGVVVSMVDSYRACVKMKDRGAKLKLSQEHLETVIPNKDRPVLILIGKYRKEKALLKKLNIDDFSADLKLLSTGKYLEKVPYEHFSKLDSQES